MLTVFDDDENIFNAIKADADGYLFKEVNLTDLHNCIIETLNGRAAMNASIVLKILKLLKNPVINTPDINTEKLKISLRETKVLEQLGKGFSYTQIAQNLIISPVTFRKIPKIFTLNYMFTIN